MMSTNSMPVNIRTRSQFSKQKNDMTHLIPKDIKGQASIVDLNLATRLPSNRLAQKKNKNDFYRFLLA